MKVYVAGPAVFKPDASDHFSKVRTLLDSAGMTALIPLDNEITMDPSDPEVDLAAEIYKGNVSMIEECDVVLADIEPFRGPHMDPGTAFEIGYAVAKGKKVYAYTSRAYEPLISRVSRDGTNVENFGETENLMITVPSECIFQTLEEAVIAIKSNLGSSSSACR